MKVLSYILTAFSAAFLSCVVGTIYLVGYFDFDTVGITLHGYHFRSAIGGDLFIISDRNNEQVVPAGAVLSVIRPQYWIGYYDGGCYYRNSSVGRVDLKRVFFVIDDEGLSFYLPHPDNEGIRGQKVDGEIYFL